MKVLYVGVYKDGTGWANAAQSYILALDAAGIDVVPRAIKHNFLSAEVHPRILELEKQSSRDCDVIIQNVLPMFMEYSGHFQKNIGLYFTETDSIKSSSWPAKLNLMDELWVCNEQMVDAARVSGINKPIRVFPIPCDTQRYEASEYSQTNSIGELSADRFRFYFIGEVKRRKNLVALLKAFHLEFGVSEPVDLIIKANLAEHSEQECLMHINEVTTTVKENLKLYRDIDSYKTEVVMTKYLDDKSLLDLHKMCDCLVAPSFSEAWCIPAFDAMAMGKTPIVNAAGGMKDFVTKDNGWLVGNSEEPAFGMKDTFHELYSGRENWWNINISELRKAMRESYKNKDLKRKKAEQGVSDRYEFSLSLVGEQMGDAIHA